MPKNVAVTLMKMWSDPGYRPSTGWQVALLVEATVAADCAAEENALWELDGTEITADDLLDAKISEERSGVCTYSYTEGMYSVPAGKLVIQKSKEDICTNDEAHLNAWIVDEASLHALYEERAKRYKRLAEACLPKPT